MEKRESGETTAGRQDERRQDEMEKRESGSVAVEARVRERRRRRRRMSRDEGDQERRVSQCIKEPWHGVPFYVYGCVRGSVSGAELMSKYGINVPKEPTELLIDFARKLLLPMIPEASVNERREALVRASNYVLSKGVTTVVDLGRYFPDVYLWEDASWNMKIRSCLFFPMETWSRLVSYTDHAENYGLQVTDLDTMFNMTSMLDVLEHILLCYAQPQSR
ncbi:hypothetical protein Droror1_Dr00002182 [Drosera rotundifolia]